MKFHLITPARQVASLEAAYVTIPGEDGDFGVLPGHIPLIATLRPGGEVRVTDTGGSILRYQVGAPDGGADNFAGFADVRTDGVTILAEQVSENAA